MQGKAKNSTNKKEEDPEASRNNHQNIIFKSALRIYRRLVRQVFSTFPYYLPFFFNYSLFLYLGRFWEPRYFSASTVYTPKLQEAPKKLLLYHLLLVVQPGVKGYHRCLNSFRIPLRLNLEGHFRSHQKSFSTNNGTGESISEYFLIRILGHQHKYKAKPSTNKKE